MTTITLSLPEEIKKKMEDLLGLTGVLLAREAIFKKNKTIRST